MYKLKFVYIDIKLYFMVCNLFCFFKFEINKMSGVYIECNLRFFFLLLLLLQYFDFEFKGRILVLLEFGGRDCKFKQFVLF